MHRNRSTCACTEIGGPSISGHVARPRNQLQISGEDLELALAKSAESNPIYYSPRHFSARDHHIRRPPSSDRPSIRNIAERRVGSDSSTSVYLPAFTLDCMSLYRGPCHRGVRTCKNRCTACREMTRRRARGLFRRVFSS